jgi:large subunit ribosomal protein L25
MAEIRISAQVRDPKTTTGMALRRAGYVPAVYYNRNGETRCLQFERLALTNLLRKEIGLLHVDVAGEALPCIIREVQRHPVRRDIIHIDLMGIVKGQKITAHVPIHIIGIAVGIKEGGSVELVLRDLEIECEPVNLPTHFDLDVTALNVNDGIRISDLHFEGISIFGDPQSTVVHCVPPRTASEETAAPTAEAKEPEILREKKVEEAAPEKDKKK